LKKNYIKNKKTKWIQPANKKEPCKVFVGIFGDDDRTIKEDYKIFWDGDCENGYAKGLGREIEKGTLIDREVIGVYQGGEIEPQYYVAKDNLSNTTAEGDLNNELVVMTTIMDRNIDLDIFYRYGFFGSSTTLNEPPLRITRSPFKDFVLYEKTYENFKYVTIENTHDEFEDILYEFTVRDKDNIRNGFSFEIFKNGRTRGGEVINDKLVHLLDLPDSYTSKLQAIFATIKEAGQKAINAQNEALKVKKQYTKRICNDSTKVSFMNNDEYKAICKEDDYYAQLKVKIDAKLAQINQQKQQRKEELYEQQRRYVHQQNQQQQQRQQNQQIQQESLNNMVNALGQMGDALNQAGNQSLQQSNSFVPPTVTPMNINPLKQGNVRNCWTANGIEYCK
jgi:hypothetical protein